jgi:pentapeptide MXKDX repeat protein
MKKSLAVLAAVAAAWGLPAQAQDKKMDKMEKKDDMKKGGMMKKDEMKKDGMMKKDDMKKK